MSDETQRTRILSFDEESKLLFLIDSEPKRSHLKGIVLIALDCALRRNEILTLCRNHIDLTNRTITIRAFNAKTAKARKAGMTNRVYDWLISYCANLQADEQLFPITSFKTAWNKVLDKAKISDLHFHDLRHSAITRFIKAGLPHTEVMRVSGHSTLTAFYRYVNTDDETIFRAANALDNYLANAAMQINTVQTSESLN